ncbi:PadR family transcriptional regulator [Cryobacterium frigoriphilum]|uniref:PadR family transcriptional regulator n=1 Tax=Cryobacterium frigoriphilum TaxID=1259150 RepID=A0A4R8ZV63_9MICO|nr:helix-turn-helix transcriptional regulator [Cryobacterium frigoriphilum]TFD47088.1 PadR family transcriptional regulator [Cryobacterium frigoriphilum]
MNREALKGHLDLLILSVLADGPLHGYAVIDELRTRSSEVFDLAEGTVYPVLHRLEVAGYLSSEWGAVSGRRRRSYRLTRAGSARLEQQRASWQLFSASVNTVLRRKPWPSSA